MGEEYDIPQYKITGNINDLENIEIIKKIGPDLILVLGWSQLLKSDLICKVNFPSENEFKQIKENSHLIVSNYNPEKEKKYIKSK